MSSYTVTQEFTRGRLILISIILVLCVLVLCEMHTRKLTKHRAMLLLQRITEVTIAQFCESI